MPGITDSTPDRPISAGLAAQPLVSTPEGVVTPSAVEALTDSFRKGFITADDIRQRVGPLGQAKDKAQLQSLQEFTDPRAIEGRAAAMREATARAKAGEKTSEFQQAVAEYGPGVQYFLQLAPEAGVSEFPAKDGKPDYAKWAQLGTQFYEWAKEKAHAKEQLQVHDFRPTADGTALIAINKEGMVLTPEIQAELRTKSTRPFSFSSLTPGATSAAAPEISPKAGYDDLLTQSLARRDAIPTPGPAPMLSSSGAQATPASSVIQPRSPVAGTTIPSVGISLGPKAAPLGTPVKMTGEQQKGLAQAALTKSQLSELTNSFNKLSTTEPWLTGPVLGRLTAFTHPENWNSAYGDFKRAQTAILANLAKGIYHETGVLSDNDIKRYEKTLPSQNDTPEVAQSKMIGLQKDIFSSIVSNIETMKGQGQTITPLVLGMEQTAQSELDKLTQAPVASQGAQGKGPGWGPVVEISGVGRVQRGPDGQYHRAP